MIRLRVTVIDVVLLLRALIALFTFVIVFYLFHSHFPPLPPPLPPSFAAAQAWTGLILRVRPTVEALTDGGVT